MPKSDWLTVAAIGLLAMCLVTFDHEVLGHGSACLVLHGRILALSSSIFRCSQRSGLIDAAGPVTNVFCGLVALAARAVVPQRFVKLSLFLALVTAFSFFWEGGYLIHAMHQRDGDLYFFARWWLGSVTVWQRWVGAALGAALYLLSVRLTARALSEFWPDAKQARSMARVVWLCATMGTMLAAFDYSGGMPGDLRGAVLEIGVASFPLLFIPLHGRQSIASHPTCAITRSYPVIVLALATYAVFLVTLGHGLT